MSFDDFFQPTFNAYVKIYGTVDTLHDFASAFCINAHQYFALITISDQNQSQMFQPLMHVDRVIPNTAR